MKSISVVGLGFGDESKGATVDKLCRELPVDLIVRFNGASQAAHNVVTPQGVHHTFSQFGSGMMANNRVRTHLSRFMLVDPICMMNEAGSLAKKTDFLSARITVDPRCVVITPWHKKLNRLREASRGDERHGSCGMGVGAARELHLNKGAEVLFAGDLKRGRQSLLQALTRTVMLMTEEIESLGGDRTEYSEVLEDCRSLLDQYENWDMLLRMDEYVIGESKCAVFEGAQGVLLDETHGTAPHSTWTNTTFENADTLLDEVGVYGGDRYRIGCLRTYHTRHGAGPFSTEDNSLDLPELHNGTGVFQGSFRVGKFDFAAAQFAVGVCKGGVNGIALSHMDYMERLGLTESFVDDLEDAVDAPVVMRANGPTADHRTIDMGVYA